MDVKSDPSAVYRETAMLEFPFTVAKVRRACSAPGMKWMLSTNQSPSSDVGAFVALFHSPEDLPRSGAFASSFDAVLVKWIVNFKVFARTRC